MTDDQNPHDPFADRLGARMHAAADHIEGAGVTRAGVDAAIAGGRSPARSRALVIAVAASVALIGGLAVVHVVGDRGAQHLEAGATTTTDTAPDTVPCMPLSSEPLGWLRLTLGEAQALAHAGLLTADELAHRSAHAFLLTRAGLRVLPEHDGSPVGQQLFELSRLDQQQLHYLGEEPRLTWAQQVTMAHGFLPVLTRDQVDGLFAAFPDLQAVPAGGEPLDPPPPVQVDPSSSTTTTPGPPSAYQGSVALLRAQGLLSPEQESELDDGGLLMLTQEQVAAIVAYERGLSGGQTTTTTAASGDAGRTCESAVVTDRPTTTAPHPTTTAELAPTTTTPADTSSTTTVDPATPKPGDEIARLTIPAIEVDATVRQGVEAAQLRAGPGHYSETPLPGQAGNVVVAGHRTTFTHPFQDLDQLQQGDQIIFETARGRFVYEVTGLQVVDPAVVGVLADQGDDRVTLIADHPKYSAEERLVVTAQLVGRPSP